MVDSAFVARYSLRVATLIFAFWCALVVWPMSLASHVGAVVAAVAGAMLAVTVVLSQRRRARQG